MESMCLGTGTCNTEHVKLPLRVPASPTLILPHSQIANSIVLQTDPRDVCFLVKHLFEAGILLSDDWKGQRLSDYLHTGLKRWFNRFGPFRYFSLALSYSNDDYFYDGADTSTQHGAFAIRVEDTVPILLGDGITKLNTLYPDMGYDVWAILEKVLSWCLSSYTPCDGEYCSDMIMDNEGEVDPTEEVSEDRQIVTGFREIVPRGMRLPEYSTERLWYYLHTAPEGTEVADLMQRVHNLACHYEVLKHKYPATNIVYNLDVNPGNTLLIRWSELDNMNLFFDWHEREQQDTGEYTDIVSLVLYEKQSSESLLRALDFIGAVMNLAVEIDAILYRLLHLNVKPDMRLEGDTPWETVSVSWTT